MTQRAIAWFSCGAASAVAAKLAIEKYGENVSVVYCNTMASEHPDNRRFFDDIQNWLNREIQIIKSEKYETIDDVFQSRQYISGVAGAPCTVEMKKVPRFAFQRWDDLHIFGYTTEERKRIAQFEENNPDMYLDWILRDRGYSKKRCLYTIADAGIRIPEMYQLGFENNNCIGCGKASAPHYWQLTRRYFPETFERRAEQSRRFGARLVRINGERRFLDELPPDSDLELWQTIETVKEDLSCGPQCTGHQAPRSA